MGINHKVVDQKFDEDSVNETDPVMCSKLIVEGKKHPEDLLFDEKVKISGDISILAP